MKLPLRFGIALGISLLMGWVYSLSAVESIELAVSDQLVRVVGKRLPPQDIIVVAIDEPSYRELNVGFDQPWPRALHAKLLRRLKELGASKVIFDVLFTGPGRDPLVDQELAQALANIPSVIGTEAITKTVAKQGGGIVVEELDRPFQEFRKVASEALVNLDINTRDGYIRTFPFATSDQTRKYPFLGFAARDESLLSAAPTPSQRDLIRYYGAARENARIVSFWEMFEEMSPREAASFKDATVFVGLLLRSDTGVAQKDSYLSPFGGDMIFGVEIHATIAGNLRDGSWIHRPSRAAELSLQALASGAFVVAALYLSPVTLAIVGAGTILTWVVSAFFSLKSGLFLAGAAAAFLFVPTTVLVSAVTSYMTTRRSEEALKSAFSLYISPEMVSKIGDKTGALTLGGEKLWLTAVFTDIVDFTSITEDMPAERTSEMLNAYFTEVMDVIFANQGTLIKFIGDAVFAVWGAPITIANHAEMALKTAQAIRDEVSRFNASNRFPPLHTRIGVHTGPMLVGNLGSKRRFDYTAIGDSVNLASRVEGLNKYFGTDILFTEATRKDAGGFAAAVPIATVRVKGRKEPVALFTLFQPPLANDVERSWNECRMAFSQAEFTHVRAKLAQIATREPRLKVACDLYANYCIQYEHTPPSRGWEGELDFDTK
jgi:adenylate cyclase